MSRQVEVCKLCSGQTHFTVVCDQCGQRLGNEQTNFINNIPILLHIEDTLYDFCSLNCLNQFITEELKQESQ
jgi:hypothetical protein